MPKRARRCSRANAASATRSVKGAKARVGPALNGIYGRRAGDVDGFTYSKAMTRMGNDGLIWTLETLDPYLENPKALISGTRCPIVGSRIPATAQTFWPICGCGLIAPATFPRLNPRPARPTMIWTRLFWPFRATRTMANTFRRNARPATKATASDQGIPSITGWPEEDFVVAMHAYKRKLRPHPVMQMMAGRLNDEEIAALAAWFATLE